MKVLVRTRITVQVLRRWQGLQLTLGRYDALEHSIIPGVLLTPVRGASGVLRDA